MHQYTWYPACSTVYGVVQYCTTVQVPTSIHTPGWVCTTTVGMLGYTTVQYPVCMHTVYGVHCTTVLHGWVCIHTQWGCVPCSTTTQWYYSTVLQWYATVVHMGGAPYGTVPMVGVVLQYGTAVHMVHCTLGGSTVVHVPWVGIHTWWGVYQYTWYPACSTVYGVVQYCSIGTLGYMYL